MNMKGAEQLGINAKKQKPEKNSKENNAKEKLERDLRSCMNNEKCGAGKQKTEKQQESKCVGCPYGKNSRYCFPCMRDLLGK